MLPWLQKTLPKSYLLALRLLGFTSCLHMIVIFLIFFMYQGDSLQFKINLNAQAHRADAPIVFMPLYKTIKQKKMAGRKASAEQPLKSASVKPQKSITHKEQKKSSIKEATQLVSPKKNKVKKTEKKDMPKSKKEKVEAEKIEAKKIAEKKEEALKKEVTPKELVEKKQEEIVPAPQKEMIKEAIEEKKIDSALGDQIDILDDDVHYVGRADLDALQMQDALSQEILHHWQPPVGVPKDRTCEIKVLVDWQGKTNKVVVEKSSKVLIFDTSARSAVLAMNFPKGLWGKEFSITFKQ